MLKIIVTGTLQVAALPDATAVLHIYDGTTEFKDLVTKLGDNLSLAHAYMSEASTLKYLHWDLLIPGNQHPGLINLTGDELVVVLQHSRVTVCLTEDAADLVEGLFAFDFSVASAPAAAAPNYGANPIAPADGARGTATSDVGEPFISGIQQ